MPSNGPLLWTCYDTSKKEATILPTIKTQGPQLPVGPRP
jgi:hypothetical protein